MEAIPYTRPSITQLEIEYANDAVANGWGSRCYEYISQFEREFASHLGVEYVIATSSCTGALHMGLAALDIADGDEVVLADTNWIATAAPVRYLGATPVFVDIEKDSWCIDPKLTAAAITPRTKAIIVTHLYGNVCAMSELLEIGRRFGIPIIEDSAEAIGSIYHGQRAGSMGLFGVFSFHGTKTVTTGEGGAFVTSDSVLAERVLTLSNHGRIRGESRQFWPNEIGFKYKMSNVQAAIGCAQLARVEDLIKRKQQILRNYRELLSDRPDLTLNPERTGTENGAWMPNVVFPTRSGVRREQLINAFHERGIDARVFFWPLSSLPFFGTEELSRNSSDLPSRSINLPSFHDMTDSQQERVANVLRNANFRSG